MPVRLVPFLFILAVIMAACGGSHARAEAEESSFIPRDGFSADSAFSFLAGQVAFGPRVPGSAAHDSCRLFLASSLARFGADSVAVLESPAAGPDGSPLTVRNVFARFRGTDSLAAPILLIAHYDSRPWADNSSDPAHHSLPIDGANDGASGVAVILEIARNLGISPSAVPVDILFTDLEDSGTSADDASWCIGASAFASALPYPRSALPRWGILLDMVGGRNARFPREYFSIREASIPTARVWDMASRLGLSSRFPMTVGGAINDDHLPLSRAGIPVTDIIESANPSTGSFPPTWHTLDDNLSNIDPATLADVGRVVLNVIYNEK